MQKYVGSISMPSTPAHEWPQVIHDDVVWLVSPVYVSPVARVDLDGLLKDFDCELPTAGLVDAIWRAADLRLNPNRLLRRPMTWSNASSMPAFLDQKRRIEAEIAGRPFTLLAGTHKDHVVSPRGRVDLYGLQDLKGNVLQPFGTSHNAVYLDCMSGLRLCRRVGEVLSSEGSVA